MPTDVRAITDDELVPWLDAVSTGFLDRPDNRAFAEQVRPHWDLSRCLAAFVDGRIAGTYRSWGTELTVPGCATLKASAVTAVAVLPTHRRRGLLRRMAGAGSAGARDRGEVAEILYASEYPIYGRFGFGPGTTATSWTLDARSVAFHPGVGGDGTVELLEPDDAGLEIARGVFEAWRVRQPGEIWRRPVTWSSDFGRTENAWGPTWKGFVAVHRDPAGTVDGYARYHVDGKWEDRQPRNVLQVDDLHALTDEAYAGLWRYLAGMDWITTVKAEHRHPAERLPWLLANARAAVPGDIGDAMWVKLGDVARALEARSYARAGRLVLEVVDRDADEEHGPDRRLRVALDASPDGAQASATDAAPDLTIDASALGAAYLGGTRLRNAVLARGWDEHRPGALAEADALLATLDPPWTSTFF